MSGILSPGMKLCRHDVGEGTDGTSSNSCNLIGWTTPQYMRTGPSITNWSVL